MLSIVAIAAVFACYCATRMAFGYYLEENLPFNNADIGMEFFGKKDPKLDDGFDDDYDKKFLEQEKEYYE